MEAADNAKGGFSKLALKSLGVGFGGGALLIVFVSGGRATLWDEPGLFIGGGIVLAVLAMPVLYVMSMLRGRGPFGNWPQWKVFEKAEDGRGLPVISWREGSIFLPPRRLWVQQSAAGVWQLVFSRPIIVDTSSGSRASLAFGLFGPLVQGLTRTARDGGAVEARSWNDLDTIEIVPWAQRHGGVGLFTHEKRKHSDVLVAHFKDGRAIDLSDWWWSKAALGHLSSMISREFIDRRGEHLRRMTSAARDERNAEIGERKKVV